MLFPRLSFRLAATQPILSILSVPSVLSVFSVVNAFHSIFSRVRSVRIAATVLCYLSKDSPVAVFFHLLSAGNWTPTRAGIVFGQRGAVDPLDRAGMVHWLVL